MTARRTLAVLGSPIAHSQSPALHAAAYRVLGLDWDYRLEDVTSDRLAAFVDGCGGSWRGLSLTMPLKQTVLPLVASLDRTARLTGAANTLLFDDSADGRVLRGFNTDVAGIVRALEASGRTSARAVHILGGGATAASALVAAAELGAEQVLVSVRAPERARFLLDIAPEVGLTARVLRFDEDSDGFEGDLVISTLPGGADAPLAFTPAQIRGSLLLDVAYSPWPSALASRWEEAGAPVLSGLAMLVHQALLQVRIFVAGDPLAPLTDEAAVLEAMLGAVGLDAAGRPLR